MTRTITIYSTNDNSTTEIQTSISTVGELKALMDIHNIRHHGSQIREARTKTILANNSELLPSNFEYKGLRTSDLLISIMPLDKKIKSGVDFNRQYCYTYIKDNNLQNKCVELYNKNYTNCSTLELTTLINTLNQPEYENPQCAPLNDYSDINIVSTSPEEQSIRKLVEVLKGLVALNEFTVNYILEPFSVKQVKVNKLEIDQIISSINRYND